MTSRGKDERGPRLRGFREVQRLAYACPFGVIAHKVGRAAERRWLPQLFGFGTQSLKGHLSDAVHGHRDGWSPLWSPYRFSDQPPRPGLWAVGPHLGSRCTGVEFEAIPEVTDSRAPERSAFWLDNDLPHVRRWAEERVAA